MGAGGGSLLGRPPEAYQEPSGAAKAKRKRQCYILVMRYADGGGLTAVGRAKREAVRFEAAEMFERGVRPPVVARRLRVCRESAYVWRAAWHVGGSAALVSKEPGGFPCQLSDAQVKRLQAELAAGPEAHGWTEDQR